MIKEKSGMIYNLRKIEAEIQKTGNLHVLCEQIKQLKKKQKPLAINILKNRRREALKGILSEFDRRIRLEPGAPSGGGRYQSYRADAEVNSLEELEGLSSRLEKVRGVKFLL